MMTSLPRGMRRVRPSTARVAVLERLGQGGLGDWAQLGVERTVDVPRCPDHLGSGGVVVEEEEPALGPEGLYCLSMTWSKSWSGSRMELKSWLMRMRDS